MPRYNLIRGDAFDLLRRIPPASIDAVITDPPYASTRLPWDDRICCDCLWRQLRRVIRPPANVVMFTDLRLARRMIDAAERFFAYNLVWHKTLPTMFLSANQRPLADHELILIFRLGTGSPYNVQRVPCRPHRTSGCGSRSAHYGKHRAGLRARVRAFAFPRSVLTVAHDPRGHGTHPTANPVELLRWLVRSYTRPGDRICDPFMGGGSTGVAALLEGRRFLGIERDKKYFRYARARLRAVRT